MVKKAIFCIFFTTFSLHCKVEECLIPVIAHAKLELLYKSSLTSSTCSWESNLPDVDKMDKTNKLFIAQIERAPGSKDYKYYSFENSQDTQELKKKLLTKKIFVNNTQVGWQIVWCFIDKKDPGNKVSQDQKRRSLTLRRLTE